MSHDTLSMYDPFESIAFPMRASDKCLINEFGLKGGMDCWTIDELYKLLYTIHYLKPSIKYVIFTSEDISYINDMIKELNNKPYNDGFKWNIIINHDYTRPSVGDGWFRSKRINNKSNW